MKNEPRKIIAIVILSFIFLTVLGAIVASLTTGSDDYSEPITTWDQKSWTEVGGFEMEGNNTTYKKLIGIDAKSVDIRIDHFTSPEPVYFRLLVRQEFSDGHFEILAERISVPATTTAENFTITAPVQKGMEIRIDTQVYNADGIYVPDLTCDLSYSYKLN